MAKGKKGTGKGTIYARGATLYVEYYDESGRRRQKSTGLQLHETDKAKAVLRDLNAMVRRAKRLGTTTERHTVASYAKVWFADREGTGEHAKEQGRHARYIAPQLGDVFLDELRPADVATWVGWLQTDATTKQGKPLAPRTVYAVFGQLKTLLKHAVFHEVIAVAPIDMPRGTLPPKEDADPEWREGARFTEAELVRLMTSPVVGARGPGSNAHECKPDPARRVLNALKVLTGARHGEVAGVRWRNLDLDVKPLGRLVVAASYLRASTKTGKTREVPVHPLLAEVLREWRATGWREQFGREPEPDDLIVPDPVTHSVRSASNHAYWHKQDLQALGMRARRGHDFRRTLISMGQDHGARREVLEAITHKGNRTVMGMYSSFAWPTLCEAIACIELPMPGGEGGGEGAAATDLVTTSLQRRKPTLQLVANASVLAARSGEIQFPDRSDSAHHDGASSQVCGASAAHDASLRRGACNECGDLRRAAKAVLAVLDAGGDASALAGYLRHALTRRDESHADAENASA